MLRPFQSPRDTKKFILLPNFIDLKGNNKKSEEKVFSCRRNIKRTLSSFEQKQVSEREFTRIPSKRSEHLVLKSRNTRGQTKNINSAQENERKISIFNHISKLPLDFGVKKNFISKNSLPLKEDREKTTQIIVSTQFELTTPPYFCSDYITISQPKKLHEFENFRRKKSMEKKIELKVHKRKEKQKKNRNRNKSIKQKQKRIVKRPLSEAMKDERAKRIKVVNDLISPWGGLHDSMSSTNI